MRDRPLTVTALLMAACAATAAAASATAAEAEALPVAVANGDPHISFSGRWDQHDPAAARCAWPACAVRVRFHGSAANAVLAGGHDIAFQVLIDGAPASTIQLADGQSVYQAASALPERDHTIELMKRTESFQGIASFKGFQLSAGAKLLSVEKPNRRIEFIGDSITCGYGDEAASQNEHFSPRTANAALAWGAVAARQLKADLMVEAWSGIWLMDNGHDLPMPKRWERTLPDDASSSWAFATWIADAVVINLGTNDGNKPIEEAAWSSAYHGFIATIRTHYPKAHIFLCIGAMGHGPKDCLIGYNERLAMDFAAKGDARVHALALPNQRQEDGIGADWHPSVKTQGIMADLIAAAVRKELAWP
jgi:lysophospholipase L1-like esterase